MSIYFHNYSLQLMCAFCGNVMYRTLDSKETLEHDEKTEESFLEKQKPFLYKCTNTSCPQLDRWLVIEPLEGKELE